LKYGGNQFQRGLGKHHIKKPGKEDQMKCPKCRTENPDDRKFCRECGNKISLVCPECKAENLPGDKFCGKCGNSLKPAATPVAKNLSFDEKISKIQKYLPEGLAEKILSQRDRIEGEKKQVTVMFCDLKGYTALAEKLGPEEVYAFMDQVYELLIHKVNEFEGTVNELTGDGVMALFGAPIALEDAPQKAIRSALAIHREIHYLSDRLSREKGFPPIKMRIGIHSGPVVVGTVGNNLRVDFKAIGDTVNLASRMESLAEPGATYVTEDVFKLSEGFFRFENLGARKIKGKDAPTQVFRVIAPSSRRTRFDVSAERGLTPLVGREREIEFLMDAYARAKSGKGQAISIVSDAGLGKSRLLYEFRKAVSNENITFLEGKCLSYSQNSPYHPFIDILKAQFKITDGDREPEITDNVKTGLQMMGIDKPDDAPYLLELLGIKQSGIDRSKITPEAQKERTIDALNRIMLKGSHFRPLILALEDLHWIDKTSETVITELIENIPAEKILLILTYRPQFTHPWGTKSYINQILLSSLSHRECLSMAGHLLQSDLMEEKLRDLIVEKTEGIPFFVEEFIRSLKDLGIIEKEQDQYRLREGGKDVRIPSTIQDIIMSRVDALSESAKDILRTGSAIEREFGYELIKKTAVLSDEELDSNLNILKNAELLYQRGKAPESVYIFRHALIMETVYDSILSRKKIDLHRRIGEAIEAIYGENLEEHSESLARHFIESGLYEKAAKYSRSAARKARRSSSYIDAIEHSKRHIWSLEQLPRSEEVQKQIIDARAALASYYMSLNRHIEAKYAIDPVLDIALALDDKKMLPTLFVTIGSYHLAIEEFWSAIQFLQKAIDASQKTADWFNLWNSNYFLGSGLSLECQFEKAFECYETCLKLSELGNNLIGICFAKGTMSGCNLNFKGKISDAYKLGEEAVQASETCGDSHTKGMAYSTFGTVCFFKGDFERTNRFLTKAIDLCHKTSFLSWKGWAEFWLGDSYFYAQQFNDARKLFSQSISSIRRMGGQYSSWLIYQNLCLQRAIIMEGRIVDQPFPPPGYREKNKIKMIEGMIEATIADTLMRTNPPRLTEAEAFLEAAIAADQRNGTRWSLAMDYGLLSELCNQKGDRAAAIANIGKAIEIMEACGADGWVDRYQKNLIELQGIC
jgi:class 3 adenylate cyclase/tetratricopeptide (TPR) repeat protein